MVRVEGTMVPISTPEDLDRAIDEPSEWGTPKRGRKSEKRQRNAVVSVRMTEAELATIQAKAQAAGKAMGAYMRDLALVAQPPRPQKHMMAPDIIVTGAPFFVDTVITTEMPRPYIAANFPSMPISGS